MSIMAKGGSDNEALLGSVTGGHVKAFNTRGINLIGDVDLEGSLAKAAFDRIGNNVAIATDGADRGCSIKAGQIGTNVSFDIADALKSFRADSHGSGQISAGAIANIMVKNGDVEVDVYARAGDIGKISASEDLSGDISAAGSIKGISTRGGSISGDISAVQTIGQIKAYGIDNATIRAGELGKISATLGLDAEVYALTGNLAGISAGTDLTGVVSAAGSIKSVGVKAGDIHDAVIRAGVDLSKLSAGNLEESDVSAGGNIGKINLKGDLMDCWIVAGYDIGQNGLLSQDDVRAAGSIAGVSAKGTFARSVLAAGVLPDLPRTQAADLDAFLPYVGTGGSIGSVRFGQIDHDASDPFGLFAASAIRPFRDGSQLAQTTGMFHVEVLDRLMIG